MSEMRLSDEERDAALALVFALEIAGAALLRSAGAAQADWESERMPGELGLRRAREAVSVCSKALSTYDDHRRLAVVVVKAGTLFTGVRYPRDTSVEMPQPWAEQMVERGEAFWPERY